MNDDNFFVELDDLEELHNNNNNILTENNSKFIFKDKKIEPSFNFKDFLSEEDLEKLKSIGGLNG